MTAVALERAGSAPAVDEAVFSQLVADLGAQHIAEVCRLYLENAAAGVDAVRRALDSGDVEGAADAAHRLKSASGFLGATRLADLCAAVEAGWPPPNPGDELVAELRRAAADLDVLVGRVAGAGP
jgi:HPt (histidine-containing phosphotransfer) domain-containing protein